MGFSPFRPNVSRPVSLFLPHSGREDAHNRVKRYRQSVNSFPHLPTFRMGCRFGTCTVQKLAHQLYQLTDKVKDGAAPVNKISPQGYGRRRRSLPDSFLQIVRAEPRAPVLGV